MLVHHAKRPFFFSYPQVKSNLPDKLFFGWHHSDFSDIYANNRDRPGQKNQEPQRLQSPSDVLEVLRILIIRNEKRPLTAVRLTI